jgi:hypothetical protein
MATYNNDQNWPTELLFDEDFMHWADVFLDSGNRGDDWHATHDFLEDWLWENYELVLDDYIDWKDYGEWYDAQ